MCGGGERKDIHLSVQPAVEVGFFQILGNICN